MPQRQMSSNRYYINVLIELEPYYVVVINTLSVTKITVTA